MTYRYHEEFKELSEEEIRDLLPKAQDGCEESRDRIMSGLYTIVKRVAQANQREHVNWQDLMADGWLAVDKCIEKYNGEPGLQFLGYAYQVISVNILDSDLLFETFEVSDYIKSFVRYYYKIEMELIHKLSGKPTREQIITEMADRDESDREYQKKIDYYQQKVVDMERSFYHPNKVRLDDEISDDDHQRYVDTVYLHEHDPYLMEVESDMEIKGIIETIRNDGQFPLDATKHIDYDKLMIALAEEFLDDDEILILFHSFGYNGYKKLRAKDINKKLKKPMALPNLSKKKNRIIERLRNFFY